MTIDLSKLTDLSGKTALVTGASSGLGAHFARVLAAAGADVGLAARRVDKLAQLAEELEGMGVRAEAAPMDVTDLSSIEPAVLAIEESLDRVDILVNNAGVAETKSVLDHTEADWDFVLDTNLKGAFFVAQTVAKRMVEDGKGGAIVNIASILSERVLKQLSSYAAAKAGLAQATKAMALELARYSIRVNALAPGYIATDINRDFLAGEAGEAMRRGVPMRRFGELSDLDGPLLLLAGAGGSFMTGAVVTVDGGHVLRM